MRESGVRDHSIRKVEVTELRKSLKIRQCAVVYLGSLQVQRYKPGQTFDVHEPSNLCVPQVEAAELTHAFQVLKARIGNVITSQIQVFELDQGFQVHQCGWSYLG